MALSQAQCVELARMELTTEDWKQIVRAAISGAKDGDKASRDFIARFALPEKVEDAVGTAEGGAARAVIFRPATEADFLWVQEFRRKKEEALERGDLAD